MASRSEFAAVMAYLGSAVGKEPSREQAEVYFDLLGDLPIASLQAAAKRASLDHKFPTLPPAGLIRQHAAALTTALPSPIADAWSAVQAFARRWEYWLLEGMPSCPKTLARFRRDRAALEPVALRAAESYGWPAIIGTETGVAFAHFRQLYESLDRPTRLEAALPAPLRTPAVAALANRVGGMPALADVL